MVQTRKDRKAADIKLAQPDRSVPTEKTLLDVAQERQLFKQADIRQRKLRRDVGQEQGNSDGEVRADDGETTGDRIMEAILWSVSLAMLHFTFDVLVQHQYAVQLVWPTVVIRSVRALIVFFVLFYVLHPHASSPTLVPGVPDRFQTPFRQLLFFAMSVTCGCYLIYISNMFGYIAVMKQAPPVGCLWIWSVIELNLATAVASLACTGGYLWYGGYNIK